MELAADLDAPCPPEELFAWVEDLARYPSWLDIVPRAEATPATRRRGRSTSVAGWARSPGRSGCAWCARAHTAPGVPVRARGARRPLALAVGARRAEVRSDGAGRQPPHDAPPLRRRPVGPVLERLLTDEIEQLRPRLLAPRRAPAQALKRPSRCSSRSARPKARRGGSSAASPIGRGEHRPWRRSRAVGEARRDLVDVVGHEHGRRRRRGRRRGRRGCRRAPRGRRGRGPRSARRAAPARGRPAASGPAGPAGARPRSSVPNVAVGEVAAPKRSSSARAALRSASLVAVPPRLERAVAGRHHDRRRR